MRPVGCGSSRMIGERGHRLAAAGFADDRDHLAAADREAEMPSTARTMPREVSNWTCRSSTSSRFEAATGRGFTSASASNPIPGLFFVPRPGAPYSGSKLRPPPFAPSWAKTS